MKPSSQFQEYCFNMPSLMQSIKVSEGYDTLYHNNDEWHFLTIVTSKKGHANHLRNAGLMIVYKKTNNEDYNQHELSSMGFWPVNEGLVSVYGFKINPLDNTVEQVLKHKNPLEFMLRIEFKERLSPEFSFEEGEHLDEGHCFDKVSVFAEDLFVKKSYDAFKKWLFIDKTIEDDDLVLESLFNELKGLCSSILKNSGSKAEV